MQPVDDKAELSSAIIEDTLAALPVPPHAVSHVQGPILEVHQVCRVTCTVPSYAALLSPAAWFLLVNDGSL